MTFGYGDLILLKLFIKKISFLFYQLLWVENCCYGEFQ